MAHAPLVMTCTTDPKKAALDLAKNSHPIQLPSQPASRASSPFSHSTRHSISLAPGRFIFWFSASEMSWLTFATALDSLPETFDAASFIDFPGKASCFVDSLANNCAQLLASSPITSEEFDSRIWEFGVRSGARSCPKSENVPNRRES